MADRSIRGRFVWHELMTPDTAGAHAFYSKALGWKTEAWDQDPSYSMFAAASGPLGGSVASPNGAPQWLTYVATDDVAAAIEQAKGLGGRVIKELTGMPNGGKYAVLADPHGAQFGVYASTSDHGPETAPQRGEFSWHELLTTDYKAAFKFYSALFGWEEILEHDMGPLGKYFIFGRDGVQKGGMFNKTADMKGDPIWVGYVRVKDVNQTVKKVKSARGTLINGPMEVPGGDWIAQFLDPYGAMFAVHTVAADVQPSAGAPPPREQEETAPAAPTAPKSAPKPAKKAAKAPLKKAAKPAKKKAKKVAKKSAAKAAGKPAKKASKKSAKKAPARKKAGKKKAAGRKKAGKKRSAAKSAKRPASKAARGAKKKAARKK